MLVTAVGGLLLLIGLLFWLLNKTNSNDGAGIANVLALGPTVLGAVAAFWGLRSRPRADNRLVVAESARALLSSVVKAEMRTLSLLLGDTGNPRPADVRFDRSFVMPSGYRDDGGGACGSLTTISEFYGALRLGRLVLLGDPGTGKAVLAVRLLLDLCAAARNQTMTDTDAHIRIPVRLSLPTFAALKITDTDESVRDALDIWISEQVAASHDIQASVARAMVSSGWILPILDGLDEIDADGEFPIRAQKVISALNYAGEPARWPVVLTCRTKRYTELADTASVLQDATAITMQPLTVEQADEWLRHRFPDPMNPEKIERRWLPVVTLMRRHPRGRLAVCLTNPLRLNMAATVYLDPRRAPRVLCSKSLQSLDTHLFEEIVPAITSRFRRRYGSHYEPTDVANWLHTLARHLFHMRQLAYSGFDIHLYDLWRTVSPPGHRLRRASAGLTTVLCAMPLIALLTCLILTSSLQGSAALLVFLTGTVPVSVILIEVFRATNSPQPKSYQRIDIRQVAAPANIRLILAITCGMAIVVSAFTMRGMTTSLAPIDYKLRLVLGVTSLTIPVGILMGILAMPKGIVDRPSMAVRQIRARALTEGLLSAYLGGAMSAIIGGIIGGATAAVLCAALGALAAGLIFGLVGSPWPRYALALRRLTKAGRLPRREWEVLEFLDWAYLAGFVRLSGSATQFRHRDLQAYFTHL